MGGEKTEKRQLVRPARPALAEDPLRNVAPVPVLPYSTPGPPELLMNRKKNFSQAEKVNFIPLKPVGRRERRKTRCNVLKHLIAPLSAPADPPPSALFHPPFIWITLKRVIPLSALLARVPDKNS